MRDSNDLGDFDDFKRRASILDKAVKRHAARTPEQVDAIRKEWNDRKPKSLIPEELKAKSAYLNGEDYTFDEDFFALIDPNKPIKLEIINSDDGAYSAYDGSLVHIEEKTRNERSAWGRKSVIYHEYGHCIDAQRNLWQDPKLIAMRKAHIKMLNEERDYPVYVRAWDYEKNELYNKRTTRKMSLVEYTDKKLEKLTKRLKEMDDATFTKRGITRDDVTEQILCVRDTIKSLIVEYGCGHSYDYFNRPRFKETEYLAHAFENAFLGNRVFQKYLPDIYNEMTAYIKALKPMR